MRSDAHHCCDSHRAMHHRDEILLPPERKTCPYCKAKFRSDRRHYCPGSCKQKAATARRAARRGEPLTEEQLVYLREHELDLVREHRPELLSTRPRDTPSYG